MSCRTASGIARKSSRLEPRNSSGFIPIGADDAAASSVSLRAIYQYSNVNANTCINVDYDKEKLQERVAKLSGGVAVIKVGAATEIEMKEKKARVEDALHATRAAVEEGVVPGGGVALIRAQKALDKLEGANEDQTVGIRILSRSIEEPLRQIVENAGEDAAVVLNQVKGGKGAYGYNAGTGEYGDMIDAGILDPAKVTRLALQNAASVAGLLLTTEVMIAEAPKDDEHAHGGGAPGGMGGMGGMDM